MFRFASNFVAAPFFGANSSPVPKKILSAGQSLQNLGWMVAVCVLRPGKNANVGHVGFCFLYIFSGGSSVVFQPIKSIKLFRQKTFN